MPNSVPRHTRTSGADGGQEGHSGATARAAVIVPIPTGRRSETARSPEARLAEALGLAAAIDLDVLWHGTAPLKAIRPSTLLGSGKVDELKAIIAEDEIELVIVDYPLTPVQQRNLERAWNAKVLDRTGLILEIFGRRARTAEGRLQVELAHLTYAKSRLVRSWTHLERQRGGSGFLGGPGETQIELDKRLLQDRIDSIRKELAAVKRTRELHRKGRERVPYPIVALVGYTNAGKSTLFNALTGASVFAENLLFATLDPTMREVRLPSGRRIILSDTVGFISELPTMLIAAFRATLEEVIGAHVILHVRDMADPDAEAQRDDVERILKELGIAIEGADARVLEVWNKLDLISEERGDVLALTARRRERVPALVSAVTGEGIDGLLVEIDRVLAPTGEILRLSVPAGEGWLPSWLHENTEVLDRSPGADGATLYRFRVGGEARGKLDAHLRRLGLALATAVDIPRRRATRARKAAE